MNCPYRVHETIAKVYNDDKEITTVTRIWEDCDSECAFYINHQCGRALSEIAKVMGVEK